MLGFSIACTLCCSLKTTFWKSLSMKREVTAQICSAHGSIEACNSLKLRTWLPAKLWKHWLPFKIDRVFRLTPLYSKLQILPAFPGSNRSTCPFGFFKSTFHLSLWPRPPFSVLECCKSSLVLAYQSWRDFWLSTFRLVTLLSKRQSLLARGVGSRPRVWALRSLS